MNKLVIVALSVVVLLSGCTAGPTVTGGVPASTTVSESATSTPQPAEAAATRTITDQVGRQVTIPANVERIVPLGNTPRMITYLGLAGKAVGIGGMAADRITPVTAYAYANRTLWADLPMVGTDTGGATDYYPEQIIAVQPDVILCSYTAELADEIQTKTGTPTVAVAMGTLFAEDYEQALRILGEVCGVQERAEAVITYIHNSLEDLASRTAKVPEADKPTVLGAAATYKGAHGIEGVYSKYAVFEAIAANDVADGISDQSTGVLVDREKILVWNPDYIFLDSGGVELVRIDHAENPSYYAELKAVQRGRVYQYPSSTSYYANVEIPIVNSYFVGTLLYPEQFADVVFEEKANAIFGFFLGADDYLAELEAAGAGYGPVDLGAQ